MKLKSLPLVFACAWLSLLGHGTARAQAVPANSTSESVYGDARPDAPELAKRGPYGVGVRTIQLVHPDQLDILHATLQNPNPRYDRPLTIEVWYPAVIPPGQAELTTYTDQLSPRPDVPKAPSFRFTGRALRGAEPDSHGGPYPLVIVSHGYPGSRVMMRYLTENLASKGYVVLAIDHTDSTHADKAAFASTLLNRAADDLFVLDQATMLKSGLSFLSGVVDVSRTALIGYSMGGYGVLNVAGAGYSDKVQALVGGHLSSRLASSAEYQKSLDPRIKAVVALAPWSGEEGIWNTPGLAGLRVPTLFVVGDHDDVAGYEKGVKTLFDGAIHADRYLLVYENARHNIAPNPPPTLPGMDTRAFLGYGEPVWDSARLNNLNQHFLTAFLDTYVKNKDEKAYLDPPPLSVGLSEDVDWKGFPKRTAVGFQLWHKGR